MVPLWERELGQGEETFIKKNSPWFEAGAASVFSRLDVCFHAYYNFHNCEVQDIMAFGI